MDGAHWLMRKSQRQQRPAALGFARGWSVQKMRMNDENGRKEFQPNRKRQDAL
jgi:hypothetical protein